MNHCLLTNLLFENILVHFPSTDSYPMFKCLLVEVNDCFGGFLHPPKTSKVFRWLDLLHECD